MAQNIYDNEIFFSEYCQLPRQQHGLSGAPEWQTIQALLPNLLGKRVVDLGCGLGWASRYFIEQGAKSVLGLDLSEKMITHAKKQTHNSGLNLGYKVSDLETLILPEASYDFAYSSLTFHYIQNFKRLMQTIYTSLTPGAHFVFSVEHPIFMAATNPTWIEYENHQKTWPVNQYSVEGMRQSNWFVKGVIKYHRTIATTINTLIEIGFRILAIKEFTPSLDQIQKTPELQEEQERPMILIISTQRE